MSRRFYSVSGAGAFPASVSPNVAMWLDGRQLSYSDTAGTTLATSFAGQARRVNQPSPVASGNFQSGALATSPYVENPAFNFQADVGRYLNAPTSVAMVANSLTWAVAFVSRDISAGGSQDLFIALDSGAGANGFQLIGGVIVLYISSASTNTGIVCPAGSQCSLTLRVTPTTWNLSVIVDGVRTNQSGSGSYPANTLTPASFWIGIQNGVDTLGLHGAYSQVIGVARAIATAENESMLGFLGANQAARWAPVQVPLVMVSGDSIARGYLLEANRANIWTFKMLPGLKSTQFVNMINTAITGYTLAQMATDYSTKVAPAYSASRSRNVLVAAGGTNTIAVDNADGPTTLAQYYAYCDTAKAAGFRIVTHTILPRIGTGHDATFETARLYFNTHVLAEFAGRGYLACADCAAIPQAADPSNLTWYLDGIHPTVALQALMTPVYQAATQAAVT